jgi:hypothetical protein
MWMLKLYRRRMARGIKRNTVKTIKGGTRKRR